MKHIMLDIHFHWYSQLLSVQYQYLRFLTQGKVRRFHILQRAASTIFAILFSCSTIAMNNIVFCSLVTRIITHLIVNTAIQLERSAWVQVIIIVGNDALKGHGAIKGTNLATPSMITAKISFSDNINKCFVRIHGRPQD